MLHADHVVSLTHAAVAEVRKFDYLDGRMPPISVIPTCADLARFIPIDGRRVIFRHIGATGFSAYRS